MRPLLSVIIPTFNSEETILDTLQSVFCQTVHDFEVIVIDGISKDRTLPILNKFKEQRENLIIISEKDKGVYDAMNKGITISKGRFLYFMGSDDVFYTDKIIEKFFSSNNLKYDMIYGNVEFKKSKRIHSGKSNLNRLMSGMSICHQAIFYKKSVFEKVGLYNLKYFIHADYDFNMRCFQNNAITIKYVDDIVAVFNESGLSGVNSNGDGYLTYLTELNVATNYDKLELYNENVRLRKQNGRILNSIEYRLGHFLVTPLKKIKTFFK